MIVVGPWDDSLQTAGDVPVDFNSTDHGGYHHTATLETPVGAIQPYWEFGNRYAVNHAEFTFGDPAGDTALAWPCAWSHALYGETFIVYWNTPTTSAIWSGSGSCDPLGPVESVTSGVSAFVGAGWAGSDDGLDIAASVRYGALLVDFPAFLAAVAAVYGPDAGYGVPIPPDDHSTLEWEYPDVDIVGLALAPDEPTTNTNTGTVTWYDQDTTGGNGGAGLGPDLTDVSATAWWVGGGIDPAGTRLMDYPGGTAAFVPYVPAEGIEAATRHVFAVVPVYTADGTDPAAPGTEERGYLWLAVEVQIRARRFRWITDAPDPVTRLYPRDDGRGNSSAPRVYPSSKSARTVGGYT